jgi:hypothetical protein
MEKLNHLKYHLLVATMVSGIIIILSHRTDVMFFIMIFTLITTLFLFIHIFIDTFILPQKPSYFNYSEDIFYNMKWQWDWNRNKQVLNLTAYCTSCNEVLYFHYDSLLHKTEFICQACNKQLANVNSSYRNFVQQSVKSSITRKLKKENPSF